MVPVCPRCVVHHKSVRHVAVGGERALGDPNNAVVLHMSLHVKPMPVNRMPIHRILVVEVNDKRVSLRNRDCWRRQLPRQGRLRKRGYIGNRALNDPLLHRSCVQRHSGVVPSLYCGASGVVQRLLCRLVFTGFAHDMCTHTCLLIPRTLWALPSGDAMKYPMVKVCSTTVHSARSPPRRPTSNNDRISLAMFTAAMSLPGACEGGGRNDRNSSNRARGGGGACRFWWSLSSATICLFFLSTL